MSASQIQAENANFLAALNRGEITLDQYQAAMKFQNQRSQTQPVINEQADASENPYAQGSGSNFTYVNPKLIPRNEKIEQTQRVLEQKQTAQTFMEPSPTVDLNNPSPAPAPHPAREYTSAEGKPIVDQGLQNLKDVGLATGAVIAAPVLGPVGVAVGAGLGVGTSQAVKSLSGGGLLTGEEAFEAATTGVVFSGAGKLAYSGLKAIGAGAIVEGVGQGATKIVTGAAGRIGMNTALGAGGSYILSGGDTNAAVEGAKYGLIFGLGGEIIGIAATRAPIPKYGKVRVPLENKPTRSVNQPEIIELSKAVKDQYGVPEPKIADIHTKSGAASNIKGDTIPIDTTTTALIKSGITKQPEVVWKGLYLSRGSEATRLTGKVNVPENALVSKDYVPQSNIESNVALEVMRKGGYSKETVQNVVDVRTVMRTTQNTKVGTIDEALPAETNTLNPAGVKVVKEYVIANKENVKMLYGSYTTRPQLAKTFEYSKAGKSALRTPGDIDIQLTTNEAGAVKFASELTGKLRESGADVRVSPEKPTLIETNVGGGKYAHAVDIHFKGESADVLTPTTDVAWGFKFDKPTVKQEGIPTMALNEQGLRKGASILGFKEDATVGPDTHRVKDVPDYFQVQRTLIEKIPTRKTVKATEALKRSQEYYGVTEISDVPVAPKPVVYRPQTEIAYSKALTIRGQRLAASTPITTSTDKPSTTAAYSPAKQTSQMISKAPYNIISYQTYPSSPIASSKYVSAPKSNYDKSYSSTNYKPLPTSPSLIKYEYTPSPEPTSTYTYTPKPSGPDYPIYPTITRKPPPSKPDPTPTYTYTYTYTPSPPSPPSTYTYTPPPTKPDPTSYYPTGKSKKSPGYPFGSQSGLGQPDMMRDMGSLSIGKRKKQYPIIDAKTLLNSGK